MRTLCDQYQNFRSFGVGRVNFYSIKASGFCHCWLNHNAQPNATATLNWYGKTQAPVVRSPWWFNSSYSYWTNHSQTRCQLWFNLYYDKSIFSIAPESILLMTMSGKETNSSTDHHIRGPEDWGSTSSKRLAWAPRALPLNMFNEWNFTANDLCKNFGVFSFPLR